LIAKPPFEACLATLRLLEPKADNDHEVHIAHQAIEHYFEQRGGVTPHARARLFKPLHARYTANGFGNPYLIRYMYKLAAQLSASASSSPPVEDQQQSAS